MGALMRAYARGRRPNASGGMSYATAVVYRLFDSSRWTRSSRLRTSADRTAAALRWLTTELNPLASSRCTAGSFIVCITDCHFVDHGSTVSTITRSGKVSPDDQNASITRVEMTQNTSSALSAASKSAFVVLLSYRLRRSLDDQPGK